MQPPITGATAPNPRLRDTYYTENQLAKELPRCSVRKLRTWRNLRIGPPWTKIGREVVYLRDEAEQWMREKQILISRARRMR